MQDIERNERFWKDLLSPNRELEQDEVDDLFKVLLEEFDTITVLKQIAKNNGGCLEPIYDGLRDIVAERLEKLRQVEAIFQE